MRNSDCGKRMEGDIRGLLVALAHSPRLSPVISAPSFGQSGRHDDRCGCCRMETPIS